MELWPPATGGHLQQELPVPAIRLEPLLIIYQPFRERFQVGPGIKGCCLLFPVSFLPLPMDALNHHKPQTWGQPASEQEEP